MTVQLGSQQFFAIKAESVRNTAEVVPDTVLAVTNHSFRPEITYEGDEILYESRDNRYDERVNKIEPQGSVSGKIRNTVLSWLYKNSFDVTSPGTDTDGHYTHECLPLEEDASANPTVSLPTFTVFVSEGKKNAANEQVIYKARGCVIGSFDLTIGDGEGTFTANLMGLEWEEVTDGTEKTNILAAVTYSAPDPMYNFGGWTIKHADTVSDLAASGVVFNARNSVTISVDNRVEYDISTVAASTEHIVPKDTLAGTTITTIQTNGLVRDDTFNSYYLNGTKRAWEFRNENKKKGLLGTSSTQYEEFKVQIQPSNVKYERQEVASGENDYLSFALNIDFPIKDNTDGWSYKHFLTNTSATL